MVNLLKVSNKDTIFISLEPFSLLINTFNKLSILFYCLFIVFDHVFKFTAEFIGRYFLSFPWFYFMKKLTRSFHVLKSTFCVFFSTWVFFYKHSRFTWQQWKGETIFLTPLYHFLPLNRYLDISWEGDCCGKPIFGYS